MKQVTIDGRELSVEEVAATRAPLSFAQREILREVIARGSIKAKLAGEIIHAHRSPPCRHCRIGACAFQVTDGTDALLRLAARGLVKRVSPGTWGAAR